MDHQWYSMKRISKCIPKQQRAKVQGKKQNKRAKGRKEQRKWKKERKGEELVLLHVSNWGPNVQFWSKRNKWIQN